MEESERIRPHFTLKSMLFGSDGLRSGWRVLLFALAAILALRLITLLLRLLPAVGGARAAARSGLIPVGAVLFVEPLQALGVIAVTGLFAAFERKPWSAYGLPWKAAFGPRFWTGVIWGIAAISVELGVTAAFGGFRLTGVALPALSAIAFALAWAVVFLAAGFFEELLFRAYALQTLARGIGYWPAALVLSLLFGAVHLQNFGEGWAGALGAALVAAFFCLTIQWTGSLWFAIGVHSSWDFGETFVYGVPDSGLRASGHLLNSQLRGPWWLSGGSVGPEGSLICLAVVIAMIVLFRLVHPHGRLAGPDPQIRFATRS